jgi:heme O synthase-like polyprenyltransferase
MRQNVTADQHVPRLAMAVAAGVGAAVAPRVWLKTSLFAAAAGLLASVATGYCPITAALDRGGDNSMSDASWRTLKTYRVHA